MMLFGLIYDVEAIKRTKTVMNSFLDYRIASFLLVYLFHTHYTPECSVLTTFDVVIVGA